MLFVQIILPVFLVIASGYLLEKTSPLDFRTLTNTSLYLFTPALVLSALLKQPLQLELAGDLFCYMVLYTGALLALAVLCGRLLRFGDEERRALSLSTVMMNVGNFGLPLSFFAFGQAGLEISILTFVMFNIPLGTLAIVIAQGKGTSLSAAMANTARIPIFHAVIVAFLLKGLQVELPMPILRPIELLGQAAIPVMLVLLGMQLARTRLQGSLPFLGLATGIRLALAPLLAWSLTRLIALEPLTANVVILQTSTPAAVLPLLYSLRFNTRPDLVAGAILVTTALSAVSLTLVLYLLPALP